MPLLNGKKKEEQLLLFSQQLQATWGEDGEQNKKRGMDYLIDVKLQLWSVFHKVEELTKSARFAQTPSSYIDLDFHSLFYSKVQFFWVQHQV